MEKIFYLCHNISMKKEHQTEKEVIEAEIIDEKGLPIPSEESPEQNHGPQTDIRRVGFLTGFFALAFSFVMILLMAIITVFIIFPLMLLGRLLGLQIKTFRK